MTLKIGIDVGGTFTDLVAVDDSGFVTLAKSPSTPADQSIGVMEGLARLAEALGTTRAAMLAADATPAPIEAGESTITTQISGQIELDD